MESALEKAIRNGYTSLPYNKIYLKYKNTKGTAKRICAELMVDALTRESRMLFEDDIDDFFETIELDSLWHLALDSKNLHLKDEARKRVISYLITEDNVELLEEKINLDEKAEELEAKVLKLQK